MAKASLTLPNGIIVTIEGPPDEVKTLLDFYGGEAPAKGAPVKKGGRAKKTAGTRRSKRTAELKTAAESVDLSQIVNLVKSCDEAEAIETNILDRTSQVDRTLLPLYIVHEHLDNAFGLSSGDISKVLTDLGVPVSTPNASNTLSGTASKYVIGDRVRRRGQPVRYKLSRRGEQYMKSVIAGTSSDAE